MNSDAYQHIIQRRSEFPALSREHNGFPLAYFDGPGGTQVPMPVLHAMNHYYENCNANAHGYFLTSMESDRMIQEARVYCAAMLNAEGPQTISFGANMTTLNFSLSRAIGKFFSAGDEILISQLDHEANRGPWLNLQEQGISVKEIKMEKDGTLDYQDLEAKIGSKTRMIAVGMASNALGTVNRIDKIRDLSKESGIWLLVDAVHFVPHFPVDVQALGVDFLLCSAYKFYGPHVGILYSRPGVLDTLDTDRLRTQQPGAPFKIETGTLNHAALAGVQAAIEYIASFGQGAGIRDRVVSGMEEIGRYEHDLASLLFHGLEKIPGVVVYGPHIDDTPRAPTISFTVKGMTPPEVCKLLDQKGICAWDGHFYAIRPIEILGLYSKGGLTRVGISLYNTEAEVQRLLDALYELNS
jgi:cysteine desulfurase family protein (TIGR01976 family)